MVWKLILAFVLGVYAGVGLMSVLCVGRGGKSDEDV